MRIQKPKKKLYYSLRQAAQMLEVSDSVLKSWEKDFPQVKPVRNRAGNRYYLEKDLAVLFYIKKLLFEEKLTIPEALDKLKQSRRDAIAGMDFKVRQALAEVKLELAEILNLLTRDSRD